MVCCSGWQVGGVPVWYPEVGVVSVLTDWSGAKAHLVQHQTFFFVDYLHLLFDFANEDLISFASFAQTVFLQLAGAASTGGSRADGTCDPGCCGGATWQEWDGGAGSGGSWGEQLPVEDEGGSSSASSGGGSWDRGRWLPGEGGAAAGGSWQREALMGDGSSSRSRRDGDKEEAARGSSQREQPAGWRCSQRRVQPV